MNRVLLSTLLLLFLSPACSSTSDSSSSGATIPATGSKLDSDETEIDEPALSENESMGSEDTVGPEVAATENFANLQILPKSISKDDLKSVMKAASKSLGVQCDFCHVDDNMASDDNPHKLAARSMISMTMNLNKEFFGGEHVVTCATCHKGKEHPQF